jgi:hypothetical protein
VFENGKGAARDYGSHPNWLLRILFQVYEPDSPQPIYSLEYDKSKMVYTTWHHESTSVLLNEKSFFDQLETDKEYKVFMKVIEPDPNLSEGSLHLHWLEEQGVK